MRSSRDDADHSRSVPIGPGSPRVPLGPGGSNPEFTAWRVLSRGGDPSTSGYRPQRIEREERKIPRPDPDSQGGRRDAVVWRLDGERVGGIPPGEAHASVSEETVTYFNRTYPRVPAGTPAEMNRTGWVGRRFTTKRKIAATIRTSTSSRMNPSRR